ncbi:MAG: beta-glucosidase, partial [Myxococcaceae bacterium]
MPAHRLPSLAPGLVGVQLALACSGPLSPPPSAGPDARAESLVAELTLGEKLQLIHGQDLSEGGYPRGAGGYIPGIARLRFPELFFVDGSVGIGSHTGQSTGLPSALASAATWDEELAYQYGKVLGRDMRAHGVNVHLGGNVNLVGWEPRDGRAFETKGEDPILAGRINAGHLRGLQDQHLVAVTKHFALNDQETNRMGVNVIIDERAARETDLLAFEISIKDADVQSVMAAYNLLNGTWCAENDWLLNQVLKQDWGFRGFVMSDWNGTHHGAESASSGLDMEQPGNAFFGGIEDALHAGRISRQLLDDMVHRIVRAVYAVGLADDPVTPGSLDGEPNLAVAQAVAEQGSVLLKNEGELPLATGLRSIAVIGPHADSAVLTGGGSAEVVPIGGLAFRESLQQVSVHWFPSSPLGAIRAKVPGATVRFTDGFDIAGASSLAAASEVAIVFATQWSSEGLDRPTLDHRALVPPSVPRDQDALIAAVAAANRRTIVVLEGPGAQLMPWLSGVSAVLSAWYPGQRGAEAIANILFGDVNPSGKLPLTFPRSESDLPRPVLSSDTIRYDERLASGYKWFDTRNIEPLFPFGFGLSYTSFRIDSPTVRSDGTDRLSVTVSVTNTGSRPGAEVVQVYLSMPESLQEPPRRLVGWTKVLLQPGETRAVSIQIDGRSSAHPLGYWDAATRDWRVAPGDYA